MSFHNKSIFHVSLSASKGVKHTRYAPKKCSISRLLWYINTAQKITTQLHSFPAPSDPNSSLFGVIGYSKFPRSSPAQCVDAPIRAPGLAGLFENGTPKPQMPEVAFLIYLRYTHTVIPVHCKKNRTVSSNFSLTDE